MWWKEFVSNLRMVGYDHILSIEHEDGLLSTAKGLSKAVETLRSAVTRKSLARCSGRKSRFSLQSNQRSEDAGQTRD